MESAEGHRGLVGLQGEKHDVKERGSLQKGEKRRQERGRVKKKKEGNR